MPNDPIDPDGVFDLIGRNQKEYYQEAGYPEVERHLAAPLPSEGAAGPPRPAAEPGNEPAADQTTAESPVRQPSAADARAADLIGVDLPILEPEALAEGLPQNAELAPDMGGQPASPTPSVSSLSTAASTRSAPPRPETSAAAKPAPTTRKRARGGTPPALIAPSAPPAGFGKIGRARLAQILENVELLPGESADDYADLAHAINSDLDPQGPIDLIFVADYCYLIWELRRVRLWKHELLRGTATASFVALMESHLPNLDAAARAKRWRKGRPNSKTRKIMQEAGITIASVVADALADHLALFEALETLDARLDARSRDLLRDYECQRALRERRQNNRPVIDGKFRLADNENEKNGDNSAIRG